MHFLLSRNNPFIFLHYPPVYFHVLSLDIQFLHMEWTFFFSMCPMTPHCPPPGLYNLLPISCIVSLSWVISLEFITLLTILWRGHILNPHFQPYRFRAPQEVRLSWFSSRNLLHLSPGPPREMAISCHCDQLSFLLISISYYRQGALLFPASQWLLLFWVTKMFLW